MILFTYLQLMCYPTSISPIRKQKDIRESTRKAFWGLVTMLFLLLGAWSSTPGSGSFLSAVALELHDDENWVFFSGW